jgi:carbon monoxide dehydrogenase subunit G
MELEHSFIVPLPRERAWDVLLDVERVAPCMPGATLDSVEGDVINGRIKVKVGPIVMTYAGTARFTERDAEAGVVVLEASGKETRGAGTASATVRSTLAAQNGKTSVTVHTTLNVTGRPAQFGRGVLAEVGGKLIGIFASNLADMLTADTGGQPAESDAAATGAEAGSGDEAGKGDEAGEQPAALAPDQPLEKLNLSLRAYNSLRKEGIHTIGELTARTGEDLLAIDGIGPASLEEIRGKLAASGLALRHSVAGEAAGPQAAREAGTAGNGSAAAASEARSAAGGRAGNGQASTGAYAAQPRPESGTEAIDLLSVAGVPVLKRLAPVLAAVLAAILVVLGVRRLRSRE